MRIPPPAIVATAFEPIVTGHFRQEKSYFVRREGGSDDWLLVLTLSGSGFFEGGHQRHGAEPGDLFLLRPRVRHGYGIAARHWELAWAHFLAPEDWGTLLKWPEVATGVMRRRLPEGQRSAILRMFRKADRLSRAISTRHFALALNALEEMLLHCAPEIPDPPGRKLDARIESVLDFLNEHFADRTSVPQLARQCGLSVSRFAHLFQEQVGVPPQRYLEERRLVRARQLLDATSLTAAEIAFEIGFQSPFHFSRRFKAFSGKSPSAYRKSETDQPFVTDNGTCEGRLQSGKA